MYRIQYGQMVPLHPRAQWEPSMVLAGPESNEKEGTGTNIPTKEIKPVQAKIWSQYRAENAFYKQIMVK